MNPTPIPPKLQPRRRRRWPWILLLVVLLSPLFLAGLVGLSVASLFYLSSDTRAVRRAVVQSSGADWDSLFAVHANYLFVGAARAGLSFVELDPKARAAVQSARRAEVSVSRLESGSLSPDLGAMQCAADQCMETRGWDRIVSMRKGDQTVAVYVPRECNSFQRVQCTIVVFTGSELVVVSAKADLEPLLACVLEEGNCPKELKKLLQR